MRILNLEDENLIVLLKQKDKKAFEYFYDKYAPSIYGLLLSHFKDSDKCTLLLQHIFLKFYKELNTTSVFPNGLFICLYRTALGVISEGNFLIIPKI